MMKKVVFAILMVVLAGLPAVASAVTTLNGVLDQPNSGLSGFPAPYGTVTLNLVSSTEVDITFTAAAGYLFVNGNSVGVALTCGACTNESVTNITVASGNPITDVYLGTQKNTPVGDYELLLSQQNASNGNVTVSFQLNALNGLTWTDIHDIIDTGANFGANVPGKPSWIEAHIGVIGSSCVGADGKTSPCTGFTGGAVTSTPEPATIFFLGLGLTAVGIIARKKVRG